MNSITIEHGVQIPPRSQKTNEYYRVLDEMKPGDSVVIPINKRMTFTNAARYAGIKITSRKISNEELRVWRVE